MKSPGKYLIAIVVTAIVGIACLAYGVFYEPFRLVVNMQDVQTLNADESIEGLRIVAISDIHGGSQGVDEARLARIVEIANAQNADLVVLLGDFVSQGAGDRGRLKMPVETIANGIKGLRARLGVYAVLGNHDGEYGEEKVAAALKGVGIDVLTNELRLIDRGDGRKFRLIGLRDHLKLSPDAELEAEVDALVGSHERAGKIIFLEHSPDVLEWFANRRVLESEFGLMLAGHTHGGQVWLPFLGTPIVPSTYGQKYSYGHVRERGLDIFVTSGVGESILPVRFMMPPEIAVLTVTR